jgi:DNA-binding MarR family transcriptional regulator
MVEDVVRSLGLLPLGSRFKRIGERLHAEAQRILEEMGVPFPVGHYPFLAALDRLGPLTVGDLAAAVGITQPGATRTVAQLTRLGLARARPGNDDQRRRVVSLTAKGRRQVDFAKREVWPRIEAAVADLCGDRKGPLLDQLAAIEDGLDEMPLVRRGKHAGRTP